MVFLDKFPDGPVYVLPLSFRYYVRLSKFRHACDQTVEERRIERNARERDYHNEYNKARLRKARKP